MDGKQTQKDPGLSPIDLLPLQALLEAVGRETQQNLAIHLGASLREKETFSEPVLLLWNYYS